MPTQPQPDSQELLERVYKGPEGAKRVEQVVIRLLSLLLAESNLTLEVNEGSGFDAIAPSGINPIQAPRPPLPGPTIVDITHRMKRVASPRFVPDLQRAIESRGAKSVLLIATQTPKQERISALQSDDRLKDIELAVWGPSEVSILMGRYPDAVAGLVPDLGSRAVAAIVQKADTNWMEQRKKHIAELRRVYFSDRLSLMLGAGTSVDCGIPTWKTLITHLALQMVDEQTPKDSSDKSKEMSASERLEIASALVQSQDSSPLLVARYLENSLGGDFKKKLHKVLYSDAKPPSESSLIGAIARLCRPSRQREGVFAIVTYNFDDLLEMALIVDEIKCRPIYEEGTIADSDELPIYHVHGRMPKEVGADLASRLVFSEESYLALQSDHYSWVNFEQLKLLRETTCLLLGLSGTDPNLRRLLDIDFRQSKRAKHYICLKRMKTSDLLNASQMSSVRESVAQHFLNVHHSFLEHSFADLGLNVIWIEKFDELPQILQQVRTHEGHVENPSTPPSGSD
jgi:hypothetical protein